MASYIGRRKFLATLGSAAVAWPLAVGAQQPTQVRRIGVLLAGDPTDPENQNRTKALEAGLRDLGWISGRNLKIDYRWTADASSLRTQAAELVAAKSALIVATNSSALVAAQRATGTIPIVFNSVTDPVAQGFVANLAQPGATAPGSAIGSPPWVGNGWNC
jgi:putative tryptophan/tyrosine transport system substrate-binding protein